MAVRISSMILRLIFVINLVLGIIFWTSGTPRGLVLVHMLLGIGFVARLWFVGVAQGLRGGPLGLVLGTFVVGLILAIVGLTQEGIGGTAIKIVHVLLALLAIGLAEMSAGRYRRLGAGTARAA